MGGLMPPGWARARGYDTDDPAFLQRVVAYHANVGATTGMPHPTRLAWAAVSSIEGNRAVKAAELQGAGPADRLLRRMREDWYVFGRPADTRPRIVAGARTVPGLDADRLAVDLAGAAVEAAYQADLDEARRPNAAAFAVPDERVGYGGVRREFGYVRFGYPTVIFRGSGGEHTVPGWRPMTAYLDAMEAAERGVTERPRPDPHPEQALAEWPLLAQTELEFLCGPGARPPADAVQYDSGGGRVWMTPAEAADRAEVLRLVQG
jgi:hypothetical protein